MFFSCPSLSVLKQGLVRHCRCFYTLKCLHLPEPNQIHPMCPIHFNSTEQDASVSPVSVAFHMILMHFWLIFLTNHRLVTGFIRFDQSKLNEDVILAVLFDYLVVIVLNSSWLLHIREYCCWESRTGSWASAFLQCFQINSVFCTATESEETVLSEMWVWMSPHVGSFWPGQKC